MTHMLAWERRQWAMLAGVLCVAILLLVLAWPRQASTQIPRIIDEHGNNLVYRCPGDPRCNPTPVPIKH